MNTYRIDGMTLAPQDYYRILLQKEKDKGNTKEVERIKSLRDNDENLVLA
jgi:hypothetical protein